MNRSIPQTVATWLAASALCAPVSEVDAQILNKQRLLAAETFWDNRDADWFVANIPFFECPDPELTTTYYYRWELLTKHLTYGSPNSGYAFTEFIDRPFWSGKYGAISCPAGHQLYESRWLRQPGIARDYARYWFQTDGAQPRNYSTWLADAVWAVHQVAPDLAFTRDLLPDLVANYESWEQRHYVPDVGLFWQTGHDDGMEYNINSRQTKDIVRGAPGFRPSFNSYMWADAQAIARIADLAGDHTTAERFRLKAASIKERLQALLWDPKRSFFLQMNRDDEEHDGHPVKARTLTYQSGQFAGSPHGRELIGYVPWQFNLPDAGRGYESAWRYVMDRDYFFAEFGPTTVERQDPLFLLKNSCCWWSGQSWPYATTQTLKAMANLLQNYDQSVVTKTDYARLLSIYSRSHRKAGQPYLAEACHPDTGSFEGHDGYNHSEHYFHSGFCDLIITGLVGLVPRDDATLEVIPLAPDSWDYFALDDVKYKDRQVSVIWDRHGTRYGLGAGLHLVVDGDKLASAPRLQRLSVELPKRPASPSKEPGTVLVNFAVNNDGAYFPRVETSSTGPNASPLKLIDGNYWYHLHPPNRWTAEGSPHDTDWISLDMGTTRPIHTLKLYFLDDGGPINAPQSYEVEEWTGKAWQVIPDQGRSPAMPVGHRANVVRFPTRYMAKVRVILRHSEGQRSGLTELEAWGHATRPVPAAPAPVGNLAYNPGPQGGGEEFPKAAASHTSRFDRVEFAHDGITNFLPTPANRWTSYESQTASDWLEIDFGRAIEFRRVELAIYDDGGGVQAPAAYVVQYWTGTAWREVSHAEPSSDQPQGGQWNTIRFDPVESAKIRVVFTHRDGARSGVSEMMVWND